MKRKLFVGGVFAAVLAPSAFAVPLESNDMATFLPGVGAGADDILASRTIAVVGTDATGTTRFYGTLYNEVRRNSAGFLDFYYRFSNNAGSLNAVNRITTVGFRGFSTDADFRTDMGGDRAPTYADRSLNGNVVGFSFPATQSGSSNRGNIDPGLSTNWFFVSTNAKEYADIGSTSLIDGATANVRTFAPVPEPASLAALGLGAIGLLARRRRR